MSECVVRMEMPTSCEECPLVQTDENDWGDVMSRTCNLIYKGYLSDVPKGERRADCPITCSLPEGHGRLVDENEVKDWVENWLCVNKYYHPYSSSKYIPVSEFYDVLQRMGEAVPAERRERNERTD